MKLTVLVPSEEYKSYAGARIRYGRLAPELATRGIELNILDITAFDPRASDHDILLFSKCHDAQSLIVADFAAGAGKLVGMDLFDDYFSQEADSRLVRYRAWLDEMAQICDFALCSTEAMANIVREYRSSLRIHLMNDPAVPQEPATAGEAASRKAADARATLRLGVAWFGVGDNPYFPIGLSDLAAFGGTLGELARSEFAVELTVLTNRRALGANGLELLRQLPVPTRVIEWSESAENEVLADALVAFLPVNAQPFSAAKSLNRAVTALSSGCQVLSAGYPLYAALEPLIYRDAGALLADLSRDKLRLSARTVGEYGEKIEALASAATEARRLHGFLQGLDRPERSRALPIAVIHGHSTRSEAHQLAQSLGGISVASHYCSAPLHFDVIFRRAGSLLEMMVSAVCAGRLLPHVRGRLKKRELFGGTQYFTLHAGTGLGRAPQLTPPGTASIAVELATYESVMTEIERRIADCFGPCRPIVSEAAALPFGSARRAA